jgi:hypothetical protein
MCRLCILTLSYAPFSTYMTFSTPLDFAASSAADFTPLPAMKAVIDPPSFVPAVMAASDCDTILPSFCSRMANVDANRAKAEYWGTTAGCDCRSRVGAVRRAAWRATENMVGNVRRKPLEAADAQMREVRKSVTCSSRLKVNRTARRTRPRFGKTGYPALALACGAADRSREEQLLSGLLLRRSRASRTSDATPAHPSHPPQPHIHLPTTPLQAIHGTKSRPRPAWSSCAPRSYLAAPHHAF